MYGHDNRQSVMRGEQRSSVEAVSFPYLRRARLDRENLRRSPQGLHRSRFDLGNDDYVDRIAE
jgi:hypothetical protein